MKKKSIMLFGAICAISLGAAVFTACSPEVTPEHKHRVIDREAVAATCSTEGNVAYQECLYCGALFLNGEEVTKEKVTIPSDPSLHVLEHHAEVQATCLKNGNVNYYECTVCGNAFSDETALTPVEETVVYGKHILKTVEAGEATCYSKAHVQHYVCEYCHQVVKGEEVTNENKSSLGEVYSGQMLEHNFVGGVCTNTGCGAQQVNATVSSVTVGTDAVDVTSKALTTPGSWQALKGETDTATITAANDAMTVNLASDSAVRLVNVPAKANAAFVGVYELSFNLKVENYNAEDTEKTLRIGFSLRTSAGTGNGDIVNYAATIRKTEENGVYNIKLFVEAATADQLLQIEIANTGAANTDKTVVLSDIMYTFYPEAAKTFVNRLEVNLPATMPEAISYNVGRINTDGEATTKVPLGQWRYYQANGSRKKGAKVSGKGFGNGMSITFSGYFGKKNTERLYYRPNVPVGSNVTVTFNLSMSMDGIIAVSQPSAASYNMKANEPQTITITYTVSSSNYIKLELTINDVQNSNFPEGGSCTIDITGVTCEIGSAPVSVHTMETKVAAKAATCTEDGNLEYYHCTHCDKYFADELGKNDITETYIIPKLGHAMTLHPAVAEATCTEGAHEAYYSCANCNLLYSDEAGANKLDSIEYTSKKLGHNFVGGVCTRCDAKELTNIDVTIAIEEGAIGGNSDGTTIKDTLIAHPGTWAVQYNDNATKVNLDKENNALQIEVPGHSTNQRAAFIRYIPANEDGTAAYVGVFKISFDFVVTKSGTETSGTANMQVGLSIQNKTGMLKGDAASNGEEVIEFEIGKTYHFEAYIETLNADEFFQFTARNIKTEPLKCFELSNVTLEYAPVEATGEYVVTRIAFAQKVDSPAAVENAAIVSENKSEYAE